MHPDNGTEQRQQVEQTQRASGAAAGWMAPDSTRQRGRPRLRPPRTDAVAVERVSNNSRAT